MTNLRGKLVRDRIPEIIRRSGCTPIIETASPADYEQYVRAKLQEELREYLESGDATELADLIEVCFAAAALRGIDQTELLALTKDKRRQRGAFAKRLVWLGNNAGPSRRIDGPPTRS
jgi:predicted house-cleaning noncanonical NTP pyrophosphatase (MazG superfamily)